MDDRAGGVHIDRELVRRQLARRLVAHRARTQTISTLTGLSRHQLATLRHRWRTSPEMRRRGPSPKRLAQFWSSRTRAEAAALAVLCHVLEAVPAPHASGARAPPPGLELAARLCEVFEAYAMCLPRGTFDFDHLMLLARALAQGELVSVGSCRTCAATVLIDRLAVRDPQCAVCEQNKAASKRVAEPAPHEASDESRLPLQTEMF